MKKLLFIATCALLFGLSSCTKNCDKPKIGEWQKVPNTDTMEVYIMPLENGTIYVYAIEPSGASILKSEEIIWMAPNEK